MTLFLEILSWVFILAGSFFALTGAIGMIRLPDFYSRLHSAALMEGIATALILTGLILQSGLSLITLKIILIVFFTLITSPVATHAIAHSAYISRKEKDE